jgi:hypothetical protein
VTGAAAVPPNAPAPRSAQPTQATVAWIAPTPIDASRAQSLADWAKAHGVTLSLPRDERPASLPFELGAADRVEELLDRARDATAAQDGAGVDRETAEAESILRAHPELPQAAFLMAEVERARATRWRRIAPEDPEAADRDWSRAEALDGGRVAGIAETSAASRPADATLTLVLPGGDQARLDGRDATSPASTHAGPHTLVALAAGVPVWAGWIEIPAGTSTVEVDAPGVVPCSTADMERAGLAGDAPLSAGVQCPRWVAAARAAGNDPGAVRVAMCEASRCAPFAPWGETPPWVRPSPRGPLPDEARGRSYWPAWATWTLAGAGVAALATTITLVAAGVFKSPPTETRFVSGGLKEP